MIFGHDLATEYSTVGAGTSRLGSCCPRTRARKGGELDGCLAGKLTNEGRECRDKLMNQAIFHQGPSPVARRRHCINGDLERGGG